MQKNVNIRILESEIKEFNEIFKNTKQGVEFAASAYLHLRKIILPSLSNIFSESELTALMDMTNVTIWQNNFAGKHNFFYIAIDDSEKYKSTFSRHQVKPAEIKKKIEQLSPAQLYFLQHELYQFWYGDTAENDLKKWTKSFNGE